MTIKRCHFVVALLSLCILNCYAKGVGVIEADHSLKPVASETDSNSSKSSQQISTTAVPVNVKDTSTSNIPKADEVTSDIPIPVQPSTPKTHPDTSSTDIPIPVKPSTPKPDPDASTAVTNSTTVAPITSTKLPPITTPSTASPTTSSVKPVPTTTPAHSTTSATTKATTTNSSSTALPVTTVAPPAPPHTGRHFDGPSFMGGIILATGLIGIGFVTLKFYKARTERNYHTL